MNASTFFTREQQDEIRLAIFSAENETSGEIRVHIETHCDEDVLDRAAWLFGKLRMDKTELRNGVLFYLAVADRKFAILGDTGINSKVPEGFWNVISDLMKARFTDGKFTEGLCEGIRMAGTQLRTHFPHKRDDKNELSDEISFGRGEETK